jgi:hypothetical protein
LRSKPPARRRCVRCISSSRPADVAQQFLNDLRLFPSRPRSLKDGFKSRGSLFGCGPLTTASFSSGVFVTQISRYRDDYL